MGRPVRKVHVTSDFQKSFHRLPKHIRRLIEKKDLWFRSDAFDPRLGTHKLKGELAGYWSYSISYRHRVLFAFLENDEAVYYDVGTHEIYK